MRWEWLSQARLVDMKNEMDGTYGTHENKPKSPSWKFSKWKIVSTTLRNVNKRIIKLYWVICCEHVKWIGLAQNKFQYRIFVTAVINVRVS